MVHQLVALDKLLYLMAVDLNLLVVLPLVVFHLVVAPSLVALPSEV